MLATNQEKHRTEYLSKTFGYDTTFERVFSSAYIGYKKPSPEFFDVIFNYLQSKLPSLTKKEVLFWDDDVENVEGARVYGFESHQFIDTADFKIKMKKTGING